MLRRQGFEVVGAPDASMKLIPPRLQHLCLSGQDNGSVIVTVTTARMMKVSVDQIVDVVAMRDGFVAASRAVLMVRFVRCARVIGRARGRIRFGDRQRMFVNMALMHVMQVAIMQVVLVSVVLHALVAAIGPMNVAMIVVRVTVECAMAHMGSLLFIVVVAVSSLFDRVVKSRVKNVGDVLVGKRIEDVLAGAPTAHKMLRPQKSQLLGHRRNPNPGGFRKLRNTPFALRQAHQKPKTRFIARGTKKPGRAFERMAR